MHDLLDYVEDKPRRGDLSLGVLISVAIHLTAVSFLVAYHLKGPVEKQAQLPARFVELVPKLPQANQRQEPSITDAPGPRRDNPRSDAQLSDADRKASRPDAIEGPRTLTPGDRRPQMQEVPQRGTSTQNDGPSLDPEQQRAMAASGGGSPATESPGNDSITAFRGSQSPQVDWKAAIKDVASQPSSRRGAPVGDWRAMPGGAGDDLGHAETGPMSFETQWFEWGDYATGMVARIRYHWYSNMPQIIRTGLQGIVTIRFTIQRNGTITDVEIISSSGVPPYDNAAKRAIELASPLAPLPANFPKPSERVTARFFYNSRP
ncbi:MAG: TonB C-terminal domain-containing protein [Acidobacteria bacterium]|nr:TonB C-terminal domain-containing protein [Acidobacteriota bacterium]